MTTVLPPQTLFGSLACQKDSSLRALEATVLKCDRVAVKDSIEAIKKKASTADHALVVKRLEEVQAAGVEELHEVQLSDSVIFPEGGGQPDDKGSIAGQEVLAMRRAEGSAMYVLKEPVKIGETVEMNIDWERRLDHMQQHSAQHLITALAIKLWGAPTESWSLTAAPSKCFINLNLVTSSLNPAKGAPTQESSGKKKKGKQPGLCLSAEQVAELEEAANSAIRSNASMLPRWIAKDDPELDTIRCRGLPADTVYPVRAVSIDGLDKNLCCGTHVKSLGDLQMIKLTHAEPVKGGECKLHFLAGQRILSSLGSLVSLQRSLTLLLNCGMEDFESRISTTQKGLRASTKERGVLVAEIGRLTASAYRADMLATQAPEDKCCAIHRADGDGSYCAEVARAMDGSGTLCLVTVGGPPEKAAKGKKGNKGNKKTGGAGPAAATVSNDGLFVLSGPDQQVATIGPDIAAAFDGTGGGKQGRYQGKAKDMTPSAREKALTLLRDFLKTQAAAPPTAPAKE